MRGVLLLMCLLWTGQVLSSDEPKNPVKDPIYFSWQVDHPVATGVISSLTLGLWPSSFGSDVMESAGGYSMNSGYGKEAYGYVKQAAEPIFRNSRLVSWGVLLLTVVFLLFKIHVTRRSS